MDRHFILHIMERYIEQLIGDIHKARNQIKAPSPEWNYVDFENEGEIEDMSFAEEFIYGKKETLSHITGIAKEMLPPPERLTAHQQERLVPEIEALLLHHNFVAEFPPSLPRKNKYPFLWNIWSQSYVEVSFGRNHIEFCDYDLDNCPFPDHCTVCKEIIAQMKQDENDEKKNPPSEKFPGDDFDMDDFLPL